jgi:hypothetical protein
MQTSAYQFVLNELDSLLLKFPSKFPKLGGACPSVLQILAHRPAFALITARTLTETTGIMAFLHGNVQYERRPFMQAPRWPPIDRYLRECVGQRCAPVFPTATAVCETCSVSPR